MFNFGNSGDIMLTLPVLFSSLWHCLTCLLKMESAPITEATISLQERTRSFIPRVSRVHLPVHNCHCNGRQQFYLSICRRKDATSPLCTDLPTLLAQHYHEASSCSQCALRRMSPLHMVAAVQIQTVLLVPICHPSSFWSSCSSFPCT